MILDSPYGNDEQRRQHLRAIQTLIQEGNCSHDEIVHLYGVVLQEYEKEAKIKIFLPILIPKRIKEMIKKNSK